MLRCEQVGIEDNFFNLGGDSILSIRVVSVLKARGIGLDMKDIFQYQTVEQLAEQAQEGASGEEPALEPFALLTDEERDSLGDEYEDAYPMSALQAGMVFHTQLEALQRHLPRHHGRARHAAPGTRRASSRRSSPASRSTRSCAPASCLTASARCRSYTRAWSCLWRWRTCAAIREEQEQYLAEWTERRKRHVFDWERGPSSHPHLPPHRR